MPSPSKEQLNLSVDAELKAQFKSLCDSTNISLAKAFEAFMAKSIAEGKVLDCAGYSPSLVGKPSPSNSPSIERLETTIKELEEHLLGK